MQRLLALVTQAVIAGGVVFLLAATITPESLPWRSHPVPPTVVIGSQAAPAKEERREGIASYGEAARRAGPSVVNVYSVKAPPRRLPGFPSLADPDEDSQGGGGLGSGVIISADGYVLTN